MTIMISIADEKDADALMFCQFQSFALATTSPRTSAFFEMLWPGPPTPENIHLQAQRRLSYMKDGMTYLKAVEKDTGAIVGAGEWCIYPHGVRRGRWSVDWYGEEGSATREWAQFVIDETMARRDRYIRGPHALLDMCFVHPEYYRRGAGKQIIDWGLKQADSMRLPAYVEASFEGRALYEHMGFRAKEHVVIHDRRWIGRPVIEYIFMERLGKDA